MNGGRCRSCRAAIRWVRMTSGKANPLDPRPIDTGNIAIRPDGPDLTGYTLTGADLDEARADGEALYISHFVTCPSRDQHRRRKG